MRCHSPTLVGITQVLPIGGGSLTAPQALTLLMLNEPRIRPTSGGGAPWLPCTPTKVSGYHQRSAPVAMSKQRIRLWATLYSPPESSSVPSAEPSPGAGSAVGLARSQVGAPHAV